MQTIGRRHRPADIRKCAVIAAFISAISVAAVEVAGNNLKGSYSGLDGTLSPASAGSSGVVTTSAPR